LDFQSKIITNLKQGVKNMTKYKIILTIKPNGKGMGLEFEIPYFTTDSNSEKQKPAILEMLSKAEIVFKEIEELNE
jgi:hypothetical protein